ncbi:unnamed protein product [Blepharisma stoltei]|uniref:Thioesterase domain-containing protein n=1 Tax=Blepharisma stoltei TaxID=1481888 RepID=A0AAU9IUI1_9CILI|nr:unnamed protein product [Blepharisma stoltei]
MQAKAFSAFQRLKTMATQKPCFGQILYPHLELLEVSPEAHLTFSLPIHKDFCDDFGLLSTGTLTTLLDATTTLTVWTLNESSTLTLSVNMNVSFYGSAKIGEIIILKSKCTSIEGKIAYTQGEIHKNNQLIVSGLQNIILTHKNLPN